MSELKSIEDKWREYASMVFRKMKVSETQYKETKQAFFSGAFALLVATEEIGQPHVTEEQAMAYLAAVRAEGLAFGKKILSDYAEKN